MTPYFWEVGGLAGVMICILPSRNNFQVCIRECTGLFSLWLILLIWGYDGFTQGKTFSSLVLSIPKVTSSTSFFHPRRWRHSFSRKFYSTSSFFFSLMPFWYYKLISPSRSRFFSILEESFSAKSEIVNHSHSSRYLN